MHGRLAQLDRVQASEAWGRGFESHAAHQLIHQSRNDALLLFAILMQTAKGHSALVRIM